MARHKKKSPVAPKAIAAHYDRRLARVVIDLNSGLSIMFRAADTEELGEASMRDLSLIEVSPSGLGIHFPRLDVDLYVPSILQGILGSPRFMAAQLGKRGGSVTSASKSKAARANGKLGGRPKKKTA